MEDSSLTVSKIAAMIRAESVLKIGRPWPSDLELVIFSTPQGWKCGLSAAKRGADHDFRETALQIAFQMQKTFPPKL